MKLLTKSKQNLIRSKLICLFVSLYRDEPVEAVRNIADVYRYIFGTDKQKVDEFTYDVLKWVMLNGNRVD